jgi:hypothetical protein
MSLASRFDVETSIHTSLARTDQTPRSLHSVLSSADHTYILPSELSSSNETPSWACTLPNLSAVMDLSHDPWTNEQIRFQSSAATLDTFSEISIPNQISIRTPGESLVVPGEPVLCKTRARETNYWPARLVKYEGSSRRQARTQTEELFCVKFCDDVWMVVPRSFFLTAFQKEFKTAKVSQQKETKKKRNRD